MELKLFRYALNGDSTMGALHIDGGFAALTLEDPKREVKIKGETAITAGTYPVTFRKDPTPMTMKYREKYDFFTFHLWIRNVPNFEYVYIHIGNDIDDTDGCVLVGDQVTFNIAREEFLGYSARAYQRIYMKVKAALDREEKVTIRIIDLR